MDWAAWLAMGFMMLLFWGIVITAVLVLAPRPPGHASLWPGFNDRLMPIGWAYERPGTSAPARRR